MFFFLDEDLCFGSKTPRKIHFFTDDKSVNSFMRKNFKESFPEPSKPLEPKRSDENLELSAVEIRPTHPFASKVPRFLTDVIDSTGVYRRKKKTRASVVVTKKIYSAFGSSNERNFLVTRNPNIEIMPGNF